eukprot:GHRR01033254.1.p1 GENE.GHRR01033254.1~~GHRR01033254.1.p1  ORF type:complete len:119 (-),score=15.06 GHRR01033254.1:367-723(-)
MLRAECSIRTHMRGGGRHKQAGQDGSQHGHLHKTSTLSESAMKNMLQSVVEISKAWGLLIASSAPLIDRHFLTSMTPLGTESGVTTSDLNQKILPCFKTNHLNVKVHHSQYARGAYGR